MKAKFDVCVVGAGLAGSEAAYQLAKRGYKVGLYEMRPVKMTPAHTGGSFAELVCSNSFRSNSITNGVGLLKEEMRQLDSLIMKMGDKHQIPAGSALAVDRVLFSEDVSDTLKSMENITIINEEVEDIFDTPVIIATGPLTSESLAKQIQSLMGESQLYFYDAIAPIINGENIDFTKAYYKSRYDKGEATDYINCPMTKEEYDAFYEALIQAELAPLNSFEDVKVFEGCMPVETMAKRGYKTLLFGPMKPVGLERPDGTKPYAVVQLRRDNVAGSLFNIVGFQTRLKWPEQKRIIQMIPGLENVDIVRYGVMHRNTFMKSPLVLNRNYQVEDKKNVFFAGQISGVEGYIESAASGLLAALNMDRYLQNKPLLDLSNETMMGAMSYYISHCDPKRFQPMNANFGIVANISKDREAVAKRSLDHIEAIKNESN